MRKIFGFILLVLAMLSASGAEANRYAVTLAWDPSPGTDIGGYNVYYGVASMTFTNRVSVASPSTNATVVGLVPSTTYYFAATATNTAGLESDFSNQVSFTTPSTPVAPTNLLILGAQIQYSTNGTSWTSLTNIGLIYVGTTNNIRFYRAKLSLTP